MKEELGRIYQDDHFIFSDFNGLKLEKIVVCENPETTEPVIVYIKVETKEWHQYFLDAGIGFWENRNIPDWEDDSWNYTDYTEKLNLKNKMICHIYCEPHLANSRISIVFEDSQFILQTKKPDIFDSECELLIKND